MSSETVFQETETDELKNGLVSMPVVLKLKSVPTAQFRQIGPLFIASFERPSFGVAGPAETVGKTVDKTVDKAVLTDKERALCALIQLNARITQKDMAASLELTERGVRYFTDKLQAQGVLQRMGGRKAGRWELADLVGSVGARP